MNANDVLMTYSKGGYTGERPPSGRITTKTVQLKAGWVGQILVDGVIVHELRPRKTQVKAKTAADRRVARKLAEALA